MDIVLNSLAEDKQLASLRCLAYGGMFLEIGKYDLAQNSPLRLETIKRNGVFHGICVDKFFCAEPHKQIMLMNLLKRGIRHGSVKPLQRKCFPGNKIEEAYRYMATGKHMGKVLIKIREEENNSTSNHPPSRKFIDASPRSEQFLIRAFYKIAPLCIIAHNYSKDWLVSIILINERNIF